MPKNEFGVNIPRRRNNRGVPIFSPKGQKSLGIRVTCKIGKVGVRLRNSIKLTAA